MRSKKARLLALLLAAVFATAPVHAASGVTATLPSYDWELEYRNVDYQNSVYPPLNYKGVTYFPMTWGYCRLLGLTSVWVEGDGLFIASWGSYGMETGEYGADVFPTYGTAYNPKTVAATLPTYPIYVNGKQIDNTKEEYPLLNFRGVTYFPMTWRFAREEFNWNTEWTENRFSVHWRIDSDWSFSTEAYEVTDTAAYLVSYVSHSVPIGVSETGGTVYTVENSREYRTLDFADGTVSAGGQRPAFDSRARGDMPSIGYDSPDVSFRTDIDYVGGDIPAPYTPFTARAYVTVDGREYLLGEGVRVTGAVRAGEYVFCNAQRYTGWKGWTNQNEELYRIYLGDGVVERIDTKYENWGSMKILGCDASGKLYLKCQQGSAVYGGEGGVMEASAYNDGYYRMDDLANGTPWLLRRFVYTDGDILTPDGHIYGIFDWKNTVERLI